MPSIVNNKIIFDETDFLGCLHPQYIVGLTDKPSTKITNKLSSSSAMNPYRHLGYASTGFNTEDATNVSTVTSVINNGVIGYLNVSPDTAFAYLIGSNNLLHELDISNNTLTNTVGSGGLFPHTISGTGAETGSDIINYSIGSDKKIFYSWNDDGADWNVGMYPLDGTTTPDDDFMTTVPTAMMVASGNIHPHPMVIFDDVLYIGDGNLLHGFDGQATANGTFYDTVLKIPTGFRITGFSKHRNFLVIYAYYENRTDLGTSTFTHSTSQAFFWDSLSVEPTYVYELDDNMVSTGFNFQGTVGCFTQGREPEYDGDNRYSKIKLFNGAEFDTVQTFIGNAPINGGVTINGDVIIFNSQGIIHQYGSSSEGMPIGLNKVAKSSGTDLKSGMCQNFVNSLGLSVSTGSGANDGLSKVKSGYSTGSLSTCIAEPIFPEGKTGKVRSVTVVFGKASAGGRNLDLYLFGNDTGSTQLFHNKQTIASGDLIQKFESDYTGGALPKFQDIKAILSWSGGSGSTDAPVVQRVEIEFETINIENT